MKWFLVVYLLTQLDTSVTQTLSDSISSVSSENISKCLIKILNQIKNESEIPSTQNIAIHIETKSKQSRDNFDHVLNNFISKSNDFSVVLNAKEIVSNKMQLQLYFVDSYESFQILMDDESIQHQYFLITLLAKNQDSIIDEMFKYSLDRMLTNLNVLIDVGGIIKVYTYFPFNEKKCRDSSLKIHNIFKNGNFLWRKLIFPSKLKNLWQCPLNIVFLDSSVATQNLVAIDRDISNIFSRVMNFSIVLPNEFLISNESPKYFRLLKEYKADLLTGGAFCTKEDLELYSSTFPYLSVPVFIVIKRPKNVTYLRTLLYPFDRYTWLIIIELLIGQQIVKHFCKNIELFGKKFTKRPYIIVWLLGFIVIRSAYEGLIFKSLKLKPVHILPQNIEEAINDGYKFITNSASYRFLKYVPELENNTIYLNTDKMQAIEIFVKSNKKLAIIMGDHFAYVFKNITANYDEEYFVFKEPVFILNTCIYFPKTSSLKDEFQNRFMQIFVHGHLGHISRGYSLKELSKKVKVKHEVKEISLKHVKGILYWFAVLCGLNSFVFVLELLSLKILKMNFFFK
ncbi:uncharacterized protein LOC129908798 [Episyrphus balteatus]|uniref:uncharacterized protein LOC129908798 n=1 Tax=Episyrphus balteatus TaxID=286459 RepID=UPI002486737A|nr:uncharacterized protein LOC129908798 [Episyrphus balteatus]